MSAPGWPLLSSIYFRVAAQGKPKYTFIRPHTGVTAFWRQKAQKDPRPHAKELGSRPALPFFVTELILLTGLGFHVYKMGRNSVHPPYNLWEGSKEE